LPPVLLISSKPTVLPCKLRGRAGGIETLTGASFIGLINFVGICIPFFKLVIALEQALYLKTALPLCIPDIPPAQAQMG
jgi:hypothetical protein